MPSESWLDIFEAIEAAQRHEGSSIGAAQALLVQAGCSGQVRAREGTSLLAHTLWEHATIDLDNGWVRLGMWWARDVEISEDDLIFWFRNRASKETAAAKPKSGGRTPEYNWDAFNREIVQRADLDGLPNSQAELARQMAAWCFDHWGKEPSDSLVREHVAALWPSRRK